MWLGVFVFLVIVAALVLAIPSGEPERTARPLRARPFLAERFYRLGSAKMKEQDFHGALAAFTYAEALNPDLRCGEQRTKARNAIADRGLEERVRAAYAEGRLDEALGLIRRIPSESETSIGLEKLRHEVERKYIVFHARKADASLEAGDLEKAIEHVESIKAADADNVYAKQLMTRIHRREHAPDGGTEPPDGEAGPEPTGKKKKIKELMAEGKRLAKIGRYKEAGAVYRAVLRLAPDKCSAILNLGVIQVRMGNRDQGAAVYKRFLRRCPSDPRAVEVRKIVQRFEKAF
jgi:tetratricopeptide (TPR) repeat protein